MNEDGFVSKLFDELSSDTITTVYGAPGCGKSTLCFQYLCAKVQSGKHVFFVDTEGGFSPERIQQICPSCNLNKISVFSVKSFEEQERVIRGLHKGITNNKNVGLIIVDSLVMLYRLKLGDSPKDINSKLAQQLSLLTEISRTFNIPILVTNQMYTNFETKEKTMVGGSLVRYWSKIIIELEREQGIGTATLKKHKFKKEGQMFTYEIHVQGFVETSKKDFKFFR
ncbi:DNA repair and recombination protein RadB [Candidatus Woesearchaeota archaeon]|nr:DNA repair and recombination protein RadB [Candidatus Woesearchaeota archaeon]USN44003.1 MAG: DNA repair and recombination protein RadB [Candidatus Woesearchaeota archaeon]